MSLTSSSLTKEGFIKSWEDLEDRFAKLEEDLETRVTKLEELVKIGTLRSCAEYSQYGLKTNDYYLIDPDGPRLGQPPFKVF